MITVEQICDYSYPYKYSGKLSMIMSEDEYKEFENLSFEDQCEYLQDNARLFRNDDEELDSLIIYNSVSPIITNK